MDDQIDDFFLECVSKANEDSAENKARPFIKWVGGKTQLLDRIGDVFPDKVNNYFEPFLGGGAVFFSFASQQRFKRAILNDWNQELVDAYRVIRDFPADLFPVLARLKEEYVASPKEVFLKERAKDPSEMVPLMRAARFLFLNRTAFNGMYRVNKSGLYNVPWGKYPNPPILNKSLLMACSATLKTTVVLNGDFADVFKEGVAEGDAAYFDPPYVPLSSTSSFTSYTDKGFGLEDQKRLAQLFSELAKKGVAVALSNSDTPIVRELYKGFETHVVPARRNINSKGSKRGPVNEVIVVGRFGKIYES